MRVIRSIETPWAPYSVMFSNDGTRLAAGGGAWYGQGGVVLAQLATGEATITPMEAYGEGAQRPPPGVAGLYFSRDDRCLVAATRGSSFSLGPTILFAVSGLSLARLAAFVPRDRLSRAWATGGMLAGASTIVRHNADRAEDCIVVRQFASRHGCVADDRRHHLTHSRMVVRRGRVLTGGGGSLRMTTWIRGRGADESGKVAEGLISAPLTDDGPIEVVPVEGCKRVTAIAALPDEDGFLTGGLGGEIDRWSWTETPRQERLPAPSGPLVELTPPVTPSPEVARAVARLAWATYTRDSVVAICTLCDGERWASVDAGGRLRLWRGVTELGAWTLPAPGTPRSLAAHPTEPWLAVGIKQGGFGHPQSVVLVLAC
jgi:hypothetical protein